MATKTAHRSNRKPKKLASVKKPETVELQTLGEEGEELLVSGIFPGNRLGHALAELEGANRVRDDHQVVPVKGVFDGTRFEEFQAKCGMMFHPKHVLDVPNEEHIYKRALRAGGDLLNEWTNTPGKWRTREGALEFVAKFNAKAKRDSGWGIRWAVCIEIGQPFENQLLTCEMTSHVGRLEVSTYYPVRIVMPTATEVEKYAKLKVVAKL